MLIPAIHRNCLPVSHIGRIISGTDSARSAFAQPPICEHDSEGSFVSFPSLLLVEVRAECNSAHRWIAEQVGQRSPYLHIGAAGRHLSQADQLQFRPKFPLIERHHASVPRLRLTTAGFQSRRRGGFVSSHFFPRSVGFGPTASSAIGALTIAPSMLCQRQAIPSISSASASPDSNMRWNTPARAQRW